MAVADYLISFRSFTTDQLNTLVANLVGQMTVLSSQTAGSKSLTRDLRELRDQLGAANFVLKERGLTPLVNNGIGTTDFSCLPMTGGNTSYPN